MTGRQVTQWSETPCADPSASTPLAHLNVPLLRSATHLCARTSERAPSRAETRHGKRGAQEFGGAAQDTWGAGTGAIPFPTTSRCPTLSLARVSVRPLVGLLGRHFFLVSLLRQRHAPRARASAVRGSGKARGDGGCAHLGEVGDRLVRRRRRRLVRRRGCRVLRLERHGGRRGKRGGKGGDENGGPFEAARAAPCCSSPPQPPPSPPPPPRRSGFAWERRGECGMRWS